jgi:Regulator of chromosome condensation (RCC1) repeat
VTHSAARGACIHVSIHLSIYLSIYLSIHASIYLSVARAASVKIMYEPQPLPTQIQALSDGNITRIACGHNHTIAVDGRGIAFTWGAVAAQLLVDPQVSLQSAPCGPADVSSFNPTP